MPPTLVQPLCDFSGWVALGRKGVGKSGAGGARGTHVASISQAGSEPGRCSDGDAKDLEVSPKPPQPGSACPGSSRRPHGGAARSHSHGPSGGETGRHSRLRAPYARDRMSPAHDEMTDRVRHQQSLAVQYVRLPQLAHDLLRLETLTGHPRYYIFTNILLDQFSRGGSKGSHQRPYRDFLS